MVYIKRDLEEKFKKYLKTKEITAVVGPRQAGKTTLITHVLQKQKGKIKILSLEDINTFEMFENNIYDFINTYIEPNDIIFIDEIQYSKKSGKHLKMIYDKYQEKKKIIVSGSSYPEISIYTLKYLVGRILILELHSLSFNEFLRFKNPELYQTYINGEYGKIIQDQINLMMDEYILYGGYPRIVTEKDPELKKDLLLNIYNTYMLRDVKELFNLKDTFKVNTLLKILAHNNGSILNMSEISNNTGISINDIKQIIEILEKVYILKRIYPFYTNKSKEIVKSPKVYFIDTGLKNSITNTFYKESITGEIYENFIINQLRDLNIKYWRTKAGAEVDIVIENNNDLIPVEIKTNLKKDIIGKSMISFINTYNTSRNYILSKNYTGERKINSKTIKFTTFSKFLVRSP